MESVLTIICDPAAAGLDNSMVGEAGQALEAAGAEVGQADWLAPGIACDIAYEGVGPRDAIAVGDGANDLAMVLSAGLGVAWRARPVLAQAATMRVDHGDLTALLFAQGYRAGEIRASGEAG